MYILRGEKIFIWLLPSKMHVSFSGKKKSQLSQVVVMVI